MRRQNYLIEIRLFGKSKREVKDLIWEINKKFRIRSRHRPVPHITLVGPFSTKNERKLIKVFREICERQTEPMHFVLRGYGTFDENRVVYIKVKPDKNLDEFRWELSKVLQSFCKLQPWDYKRKFYFHCTLALKLSKKKFEQIKRYVDSRPEVKFEHVVLRVALLRNRRILFEYDFMIGRMLTRKEALDKRILAESFARLKNKLGEKRFREEFDKIEVLGWKERILRLINLLVPKRFANNNR